MRMQMHMFGAMFAPHDRITLMAMTSYRTILWRWKQAQMKMEESEKPTDTHEGHGYMGGSHDMAASHRVQSSEGDESSLHNHGRHTHRQVHMRWKVVTRRLKTFYLDSIVPHAGRSTSAQRWCLYPDRLH